MTREEQLACLEDRPCSVCKFHTDRCNRWTCVFEDEPEDQEPCDDAISRQYLLDNCVMDKVIMPYVPVNRIENAPSVNPQPKTGWIPVSERLPEPDVEVLVTDDAGGLATISTDSMYELEETGEKEWLTSQYVTAWMPLPQPYKAEREVQK